MAAAAASRSRSPGDEAQQRQPQQPNGSVVPEQPKGIRANLAYRLPWWLVFLMGIFLLAKLQLVYNDSPCAVLGTQSPVTSSDIKKAFRTISMCTHPDRLRGRLKRQPTPAEERRGEILFKRASSAKDELTMWMKRRGKKQEEITCYEGELELALWQVVTQVGKYLTSLGVYDYLTLGWEVVWNLISFEAGIWNTLFILLWMAALFRYAKQFATYIYRMGVVGAPVAILTSIVIGPVPTMFHFVVLPVIRLVVYFQSVMKGGRQDADGTVAVAAPDAAAADGAAPAEPAAKAAAVATSSTAGRAVAQEGPNRTAQLRQRRRHESTEERESRNAQLLSGAQTGAAAGGNSVPGIPPGAGGGADTPQAASSMPTGMWQCVSWSHKEPIKARQAAATAAQFDLLLILTKPVIPLIMLISLGQVWNSLWSSLVIGHALRRWVPQMSYEAHHLLCSFFGVMHTLLGVSASQVEDYANREHQKVLHLAWSWSFKDILSVLHMCQLGATVTAMSALGNEPSFSASFASGIALRMAIAQDSFRGFSFTRGASSWLEGQMTSFGLSLDSAEETTTYSGGGIGDCGGGPFRMLFGEGPQAEAAAIVLKVWLMLLPLLATMQWGQRTYQAARLLGKRWKMTRFVQRLVLFILGLVQCFLIANVELNASNGPLCNFWVAMLFGCAAESLLSTYDIRGNMRQILFLVMFLFI